MPVSLRIDRLETPSIEAAPLVPRCRCCRRLLLPDRPSSLLLSRIHTGILFLLTAWWYDSICIHHSVELPWFCYVWVFTMRRIGDETWIDIPGTRMNHTQLNMVSNGKTSLRELKINQARTIVLEYVGSTWLIESLEEHRCTHYISPVGSCGDHRPCCPRYLVRIQCVVPIISFQLLSSCSDYFAGYEWIILDCCDGLCHSYHPLISFES